MKLKDITVTVEIATVLDDEPVTLDYIRQAVKEKKERERKTTQDDVN